MDAEVTVTVERIRCGHSARLGRARVTGGEPHVLAHFTRDDLPGLVADLAADGYAVQVRTEDRHVSMLEWYGEAVPVGPGRPGQSFAHGDVLIETTLHDIFPKGGGAR